MIYFILIIIVLSHYRLTTHETDLSLYLWKGRLCAILTAVKCNDL